MFTRILLFIFSISIASGVSAQQFLPRIVNYSPKQYGDLMTPENWSITQDDKGLMYFGNANNVLIYDGVNWDKISVEAISYVTSLQASGNKIYCGGANQFGFLSPNAFGELTYQSLSDSLDIDFSNVWRIHDVQGKIIFQTKEAIFVYSDGEVSTIIPETSFHLSFSIDDKFFVRQREIGIMQLVGNELKVAISGDDLYGVFDMLPYGESASKYLLVTQEFGLWVYDEKATEQNISPLNSDSCSAIRYRNVIGGVTILDGIHVLYSTTDGLLVVNDKGELEDNITRNSGLNSDEIKNAFVDAHGNLWLATGGGVSQLNDNSPISYFQEPSGIIGNVQSIVDFKGKKFIGTSLGLFEENENKDFHFNRSSIHDQTWDFAKIDSNMLFVATSSGIYGTSDTEGYELILPSNCNGMYFDQLNNILIAGGDRGVFILDGYGDWQIMKYYPASLGQVTGVEKHPITGDYWIGTTLAGAVRVEFDGFDFKFDVFGANDGLHQGELVVPFVSEDDIYFGTPYDLLHFVDEEEVKKGLSEEEQKNPDYYRGYFDVTGLNDFKGGHIYQQMLFAGDLNFACIDNKISLIAEGNNYAKEFKSVDIGRINHFNIIGDNLYVGAAEGVLVIDVLKLLWRIDNAKPNVFDAVIRKVSSSVYDGENVRDSILYNGFGELKSVSEIDYSKNKIIFDFSASFYEGTHKPLFSWRLVGDNDKWSEWSKKTHAEYSNLHEGVYTFEVKSKNIFDEGSTISSFSFKILTPWYRTTWAYIGYGVLFLIILYVSIVLGQKRLKAKNVWLEGVVEERTSEIKEKNKELEHSFEEIAEQKQEITDSINYAQRIQEAILPLSTDIKENISEYFVLFMPKDIVSGDFYWFHQVGNESVFVCADCTGHGVPGAFMSMIGSDKLNRAVIEEKTSDPSLILSHLNQGIKKALKQNEEDVDASRDGMDASVISINREKMKLQYSGANRPLFLIRGKELVETKATKVAVAGFTAADQVFDLNTFDMQEGDCYYMTTDGYPDQFGGKRGKKFKMKQFKDLLMEIHEKPMAEQEKVLKTTIIDWMNDEHEQIDDICIVGVRI